MSGGRSWRRGMAWLLFWATLAVALLVGAVVAWLLSEVLPPGTVITIDDERFVMREFSHFGHWFVAVLGVLLASLLIVVIVPVIVGLAIVVPVVVGGLGLLLGMAPLLLAGWVLWWAVRRWWWKPKDGTTTIAT